MKSFPQPLTASEEREYMQRYTEGDLEAKHILIERNLRLVAHIVKKYQTCEEETEDLLSIGTIGLIKAVVTFNPEKCVRLGTYAARCIENEILMYLRAKKKSSREISLYEPIGTDREGNEIQHHRDRGRRRTPESRVKRRHPPSLPKNRIRTLAKRTVGIKNALRTV